MGIFPTFCVLKTLSLLFPQWQDAQAPQVYDGAQKVWTWVAKCAHAHEVPVPPREALQLQHGIIGWQNIVAQLRQAREIIEQEAPDAIFTIGGGCGVEIAPVSYLNAKYEADFGVLWFDAHGDLNTPESSPSHRFHGMPLRTLLGEGEKTIVDLAFSHLSSEQVILCGGRDLDPPERQYIKERSIHVLSVHELIQKDVLAQSIRAKGWKNIYVHLDLDVLDPQAFPFVQCPSENGMTVDQICRCIEKVKHVSNIVGCSILECVSPDEGGKVLIQQIVSQIFPFQVSQNTLQDI